MKARFSFPNLAVTIDSDDVSTGQDTSKQIGISRFFLQHFTDRTLTRCTLAYARHTEETNTE